VYRVVVEGWTKAEASDEMIHGSYGFHPLRQNLLDYIETLDSRAADLSARNR
jgi:hypothetical protein